MSDLMKVSSNPHIRSKDSTSRIMLAVIIALLPTTIFGIYNFGIRALLIVAITIASTVLTEFVFEKITKRKNTIGDLSAVVTGLLLALNLPATLPLWEAKRAMVDRGRRRHIRHTGCEDAFRRTGPELYEPRPGSQMLPADLFCPHHD